MGETKLEAAEAAELAAELGEAGPFRGMCVLCGPHRTWHGRTFLHVHDEISAHIALNHVLIIVSEA
jgi:hypothetical protein